MGRKFKKVPKEMKNSFSIEKVGVGFDRLYETLNKMAEEESSTLWYPAYNIRKTGASEYYIDVELSGYDKEQVSAKIEGNALIITAPGSERFIDPEGDDVYFHQGIYPGGELYAKFYIADGLVLESAIYDDGIISFKFFSKHETAPTQVVPIGPFATPEEAKPFVPAYDSSGSVVGKTEVEETGETTTTIFTPEYRDEVIGVTNEDKTDTPTVEVVLPDPMPQIVEIAIENVVEMVDNLSEAPQATVIVKDATYEVVPDNVVTEVIHTEEGKSDIVVAIPEEVQVAANDAGINIVEVVTQVMEAQEVALPELPPASELEEVPTVTIEVQPSLPGEPIEVVVPESVSSVVEATLEHGQIILTDVSEHIPETADVIPVVTAPGEPDIAIAVTPETVTALEDLGVDVATDIGAALVEANATVVPAEVIAPPVFETVETPIVVHGEDTTVATVEVVLPDPLPQIVEVSLDALVETVDVTSELPQATITVEEAVHEVSDNVITEVIKTEEGKSDIVVAIPEAVHAELTDKGIDVIEAVKEAIVQSELVAPDAPVVEETPVVETPIITETGNDVTVVAPEVIPSVVEATVVETPTSYDSAGSPVESETKIVLTDVSTDIPADAVMVPVVTASGEHDVMVAVTPETQAALDTMGVDVMADVGAALVKAETEVVVAEVAVSEPEPVVEAAVAETVVNADNPEVPTVAVTLPDPMPQIVEVTVTELPASVDAASTEPQVSVVVSDATFEVSDNVVTEVIHTEEGKSDVVVAIAEETKVALEELGVDVVEAVKAAVEEAAPAAPELPLPEELIQTEMLTVAVNNEADEPKLEVTTPDMIPQVVQAVTVPSLNEGVPAVELVNVTEAIPDDTVLIPVVTGEGQPDVMVAVTPEVQATLEAANIDIAVDVSKALVEGEVEVAKTEEKVTE